MNTKILFKQTMEAEVARAQTELADFRSRGLGLTADAKKKHAAHVADLERKLEVTRSRLRELDDAEEHVWENLKDGVVHTWGALQSALQDAVENFKTDPPVVELHEADDHDHPCNEDLKERLAEKAI